MKTLSAPAVSPEARMEDAAALHVMRDKQWPRGQFRIEFRGWSANQQHGIVWAIHLDDEQDPTPGAGRSVVLHIDPCSLKVVSEFGFQ